MNPTTTLFRQTAPKAKYLLIVNKGPGAVSLKRENDRWDLLEIYFMKNDIEAITQNPSKTDADFVVFETDRNMRKFAIIKRIFETHDFWKSYDAVMMADDDLVPVGCSVSDIFDLFIKTGMRVGQPALSEDSFWSHEITLRHKTFHWRKTNFVEVMCPIMNTAALGEYLPLFDETVSGFGLDNYWGLNEWRKYGGLAILDDTTMRHCRPVRGGVAYHGLSPGEECRQFFLKHKLKHYMQLTLGGESVDSKMLFRAHKVAYWRQILETLRRTVKDWFWQLVHHKNIGLFIMRGAK